MHRIFFFRAESYPIRNRIRSPIWNPILVLLMALLRANVPKNQHFQNMVATAKENILLIFSGWQGLSVKQITTYFVWLNIDIFARKLIITELRQNATFGAQNLRRISKLRVTK